MMLIEDLIYIEQNVGHTIFLRKTSGAGPFFGVEGLFLE